MSIDSPDMKTCALCGHEAEYLGGEADGADLCHGCVLDHPCYHAWTIYGIRVGAEEWRNAAYLLRDRP